MVSRAEQRRLVWSGKMRKTTGGLMRDDLMLNRSGRIVSKKKSQAASKVNNLGTWLRVSGQGFKEVPSNAKKGTNGKGEKKVPKKVAPKKVAPKKVAPKKVVPKKAAPNKVAKAVKKIELKTQKKKKLDSKKTVVALKKKAEAKARANSKAGYPISKSKAPEVVATKAAKAHAGKSAQQLLDDLFTF
jgi:hypothetical protein